MAHYLIYTRRAPTTTEEEKPKVGECEVVEPFTDTESGPENSADDVSSEESCGKEHSREKHSTGMDESARAPARQSLSFATELP